MGVMLTEERDRQIERAIDAIHDWSNDAISDLYERDGQYRRGPEYWRARLPALVARYEALFVADPAEATKVPPMPDTSHTDPRAIAAVLARRRKALGLTQGQLGERFDPPVSHAAVSDIERGATTLSLELLGRYCAAVGLSWRVELVVIGEAQP